MKQQAFEDNSVLEGIVQYFDESGVEWRRETDGAFYKFYESQGNAFRYVNNLRKRAKKDSIRYTHNRFLDENPLV